MDSPENSSRTSSSPLEPVAHVFRTAGQTLDAAAGSLTGANGRVLIHLAHRILEAEGSVIVTGMGKSGLIARKIAATLSSTGTPAVFLHPGDALHGDMGMVNSGRDLVLALSNSGETAEIRNLIPHLRKMEIPVAGFTARERSTLAKLSDYPVIYKLESEGCPLDLAPMASTTVCLVLGDALAALLMSLRGFTRADFGKFHPSGTLGRQLTARVDDVMVTDSLPTARPDQKMKEVLTIMMGQNLGGVCLLEDNRLVGIVTDGDIKRLLELDSENPLERRVSEIMTAAPMTIGPEDGLSRALEIMQSRVISVLPVVSKNKELVGLLRLHEILAFQDKG